MDEIARQFSEELQELLNRYKDKMSTPQIMRIAQPVFSHTIGFKYNPERFCSSEEHLKQIMNSGPSFMEKYKLDISKVLRCPAQMIAEADCDGDIKKCKGACYKEEYKGVFKCTD